ncbi:hypothetical protein [Cupriavidus sp. D384]|uniref:hypothetical protein n=1 Tax=Cupriavidus sp. D384 TaxID=1538095 RepID=UPI0008324FAB|nr:hypothetical protein [Cupriavidus sp. D384]
MSKSAADTLREINDAMTGYRAAVDMLNAESALPPQALEALRKFNASLLPTMQAMAKSAPPAKSAPVASPRAKLNGELDAVGVIAELRGLAKRATSPELGHTLTWLADFVDATRNSGGGYQQAMHREIGRQNSRNAASKGGKAPKRSKERAEAEKLWLAWQRDIHLFTGTTAFYEELSVRNLAANWRTAQAWAVGFASKKATAPWRKAFASKLRGKVWDPLKHEWGVK